MDTKFDLRFYKCAHCGKELEWNDLIPCGFCNYLVCKSCSPNNCPKRTGLSFASNRILLIDNTTKTAITPEGARYGLDTFDPDK